MAAVVTTPKQTAASGATPSSAAAWQQLTPEEVAGIGYFRKENCQACHPTAAAAGGIGPNLAGVGLRHTSSWMIDHFKHPQQLVPGSSMPPILLPDDQLHALTAFIEKLNAGNEAALFSTPGEITAGALLYQANHCNACHQVNGTGMKVGPALNSLAQRHPRDWVEQHFADPKKMVPGSVMPPYHFSPTDLDRIAGYLMQLD